MKFKKLLVSTLAVVMTLATSFALAGCNEGGVEVPDSPIEMPESPATGTASVHDPSAFYDISSQTYYAFGSHYAVASSEDMINWTQEVAEYTPRSLYGSETIVVNGVEWPKALEETVNLVNPNSGIVAADKRVTSTWAPDVQKIGSKYYMYYSLTKAFGSNQSAIGRVESDNILGPYSNNVIIVESVTNPSSSNPNCIDPELFYDADGTLWMVYGSFFGGIYIKELDSQGLPVEDGFGKLLWVGDSQGVEGPFIFYDDATDYYYLMVSDGSLSTDYCMRVARSENPDGPYVDITGDDMSMHLDGGNKLAGNYNIANTGNNVALGHNSVVERRGEFYVVCHVRNALNGMHHLETRKLYFNKEGWPVLAPLRYAGETNGTATVEETAGTYDVVVHTSGVSQTIVASVECTFGSDGTVSGALSGTWSMESDYFVTLEVNGISYSGVVCGGWRTGEYAGGVYCFTATSADGNAIWAVGR